MKARTFWIVIILLVAYAAVGSRALQAQQVQTKVKLLLTYGKSEAVREWSVSCDLFEINLTGSNSYGTYSGGLSDPGYAIPVASATWNVVLGPGYSGVDAGSASQVMTFTTPKPLGNNDLHQAVQFYGKNSGVRCTTQGGGNGSIPDGSYTYYSNTPYYPGTNMTNGHGDIQFTFGLGELILPTFDKHGNNGTVSCDTYCAGVTWPGGQGTCYKSVRADTAAAISCSAVPGLLPTTTELTCSCHPPPPNLFDKHGNNGTVSCNTYCKGAQWPGGRGLCFTGMRADKGWSVSCDAVPGLLPNGAELSCTCQSAWIAP